MIRVLHVIDGLDVGGAEVMLWRLLAASDRAEFDPTVASLTTAGPIADRIRALGVPVDAIGMRGGAKDARLLPRLARAVRAARPDVVQTWMYESDLIGGITARALGPRTPVVWGVHQSNLDPQLTKRHTRLFARSNARLSKLVPARIVFCSKVSHDVHAALGYDTERSVVIPNGFDLDAFAPDEQAKERLRAELGVDPGAPLVGLVARYDPQKDHATFVRAAAHVAAKHPGAGFVLCGKDADGGNRVLAKLIADAGLTDRIHLLGIRHDIASVTAGLDVAVSSSAYGEAFPLAIGEAMASGVPCAVTDVGDSAFLVGETGRVVPPSDAEALGAAIADLLAMDVDRRRQLGQEARRRIDEHFRLDTAVERYQSLHREVARTETERR